MSIIIKSIQSGGGGDYTDLQTAIDWIESNYSGSGNFPTDGIRLRIDDNSVYSPIDISADIRPGRLG